MWIKTHIDVWFVWKTPNLSMHHLLEHINQDIKRRLSKDNYKDSTVHKTEYGSKRNPTCKPRWAWQQPKHQAPTISSKDKFSLQILSKLDLEKLLLVIRTHFVLITSRINRNCDRIFPYFRSKCVRTCLFAYMLRATPLSVYVLR